MSTQHYLSILVIFFWGGGIIDSQCCNYRNFPSGVSSKFQSSMTIFHHKSVTSEGRVLANGWTHPSSMTIFVHLFIYKKCHLKSYHGDIKYHMTLNNIFSLVRFGNY